MVDMKLVSNGEILDFFRRRIENLTGNSAKEYNKVFTSLSSFVPADTSTLSSPAKSIIEDWCVYLINGGLTKKTVTHYIDIVSGLYSAAVNEGLVGPTDVFKTLKASVKYADAFKPIVSISEADYGRLRNLACVSHRLPKDIGLFVDIFIVSLLTGCKSLIEVAMLKKNDLLGHTPQVVSILERYCESNRRYIFPLSQPTRTPRQLENYVATGIMCALESRGIRMFGSLSDTARSYWAYAAMKCGLTPSAIHSILGAYPRALPLLGVTAGRMNEVADKDSVIKTVGETILSNPFNWYAMKLRSRVTMDDIRKRFKLLEKEIDCPELFYPSCEIARRVGKKTFFKEQPIIPDIVFFKSRITDIYPIFLKIGDLAWCFRTGGNTGSYAVISQTAMARFQRAIGQFTSDYQVGAIGSIAPQPGDTIKVLDGLFAGNEGELLKVIDMNEKGVIYRLRIIDGQGIEWRVGVDSRLTKVADAYIREFYPDHNSGKAYETSIQSVETSLPKSPAPRAWDTMAQNREQKHTRHLSKAVK